MSGEEKKCEIEITLKRVEKILGRKVEVLEVSGNKYVVDYMNFNTSPPPVGDSVEEALALFEQWYPQIKGVEKYGDDSLS